MAVLYPWEHGPTACDAPTIQEPDLQAAVVQAINLALGNRESMMTTLQKNVEAVIRQEDETSSLGLRLLLELQKGAETGESEKGL